MDKDGDGLGRFRKKGGKYGNSSINYRLTPSSPPPWSPRPPS